MPIESTDLLSLLHRVRKSSEASGASAPAAQAPPDPAAAAAPAAPEPAAPPATPARKPKPAVPSQGQLDLEDLEAELTADEVLIQRMLGVLYRAKKQNPNGGAVSILDIEKLLCLEREGAAFVMAYMKSTKLVEMDDKSRMSITVTGINYLRTMLQVTGASATRKAVPANDGDEADPPVTPPDRETALS